MPPSSNKPFIASLSRQPFLGSSPDNDSGSTEPELQPKLNKAARKKQARNAARSLFDDDQIEKPLNVEVTDTEPPAAPPPSIAATAPSSSLLSQIPHTFPKPQKISAPLSSDKRYGDEKVSDQATPPYDDFLSEEPQRNCIPEETVEFGRFGNSPPVQPGFSTRSNWSSKSPPISPPQRYARPVSYAGSIPPPPATSRMPYRVPSRPTSQYGSPPAPHMPQPHFYHAQDIDVPMPGQLPGTEIQEPTLVKHAMIPNGTGEPRAAVLVGYPGRLSLLAVDRGKPEEVGAIGGLPGMVADALLLPTKFANQDRLVAVVLHAQQVTEDSHEQTDSISVIQGYPAGVTTTTQFTTSVEIYSLQLQHHVATIFESQPVQLHSYRGIPPDPPSPIGNLRLFSSGEHMVIASGTSGEVYLIAASSDGSKFECVGKLWTAVQYQMKRRDSSHGRSSDADISPADLNRGLTTEERPIIDLSGRWLAICPPSLPSRPSLNVRFGPHVICRSHAGIETITAPTKPSLTCEVDSPDADSVFGKVARGVAQELVKGAKWLGDQSYQTWQNYWKKDQSPPASLSQQQPYSSPTFLAQRVPNAFPPTHAEALPVSKEPEIVSIFDLTYLHGDSGKRRTDGLRPIATFQPPRGCSFLSFAPHGLQLLTAGRKGDVQYVWDLMQIQHCRALVAGAEDDRGRSQPRVRQIARFERLSGSTIVDVAWELPAGIRFAVLTRNRTVHIFDLPLSSLRWPPPRGIHKTKQSAKSIDNSIGAQDNNQNSFFASAMNIASKAPPMVAGWRGRAPSMGGGLAGIGQTGIGIAAATGARSSKAVAVGLSKSLGAASDTVSHIRHAGESRLHIRSHHEPTPGKIIWRARGQDIGLDILDSETIKQYRIRKTKPQNKGHRESTSVFDTRKANTTKLPRLFEMRPLSEGMRPSNAAAATGYAQLYPGFCMLDGNLEETPHSSPHPLSFAEIETNAPYQPFHSDRRVALCVFAGSPTNTPAGLGHGNHWVFGDDVPLLHVNLTRAQMTDDEDGHDSIIYREITKSTEVGQDGMEHIVSTTRRGKKKKTGTLTQTEDGDVKDDFFEDDCEVVDFATDRV